MTSRDGVIATVLAGALFGTSVPVIKLGLNVRIPPELFVELRFAIASGLILVFGRRGWVQLDMLRHRPIWIVGFINAAGYVLQFQGQLYTSSTNAALMISTAALMVPILSLFYVREKIGRQKTTGVLAGFIGTALVITRGETLNVGSSEFAGDILILGTAVTIALVFVFSKTIAEKSGGRPATGGMLIVTMLLLLPTLPLDLGLPIELTPTAWFYVSFLAIFATVGAYYFFMKGLETVSPTVSSIILPIEVIVAVILSVILFNDPFNFYSGTGAALIIAGVILVSTAR